MNNFAILDVTFFFCGSTMTLTATTNNGCHLTCYHTEIHPQKHHAQRIVRGLNVPWGTYFCFVAWLATEQSEPGDTLTHTFIIPFWYKYHRRWFTFRGEVAAEISPSVGPIIEYRAMEETAYSNTLFSTWPNPDLPPSPWYMEYAGPGPWGYEREQIDVKTPPYAITLSATNAISRTKVIQVSCAHPYGGKTLNFDFWFRTVGYGQLTMHISQTGPGAWSWTRHYGPTGWLHRNFNHYIDPSAQLFIFRFENRSVSGALSRGRFDGITITEV